MIEIVRHVDAETFLARAEAWLMRAEAEHNLLLGLAGRLQTGRHDYEDPIFLATVEENGMVLGCAWRTPPWNLGLTMLPLEAIPPLVDRAGELYDTIPGLHGPREVAEPLGKLWAESRGLGVKIEMELRIYQLERVIPPEPAPPGRLRMAAPIDLDRLTDWAVAFQAEATLDHARRDRLRSMIERYAAAGLYFVWEDGEVVSMAAAMGRTPNGIRVNMVYTPPALRWRGYATACVAGLSKAQLDAGRRFCFLYTDLANPISNSIYQSIGYRPVRDEVDLVFTEQAD